MQEVTPAAGTFTQPCSSLFHVSWPSWPPGEHTDQGEGCYTALRELPKAKEERGSWNSEDGGLGGSLGRKWKEVGQQGVGE